MKEEAFTQIERAVEDFRSSIEGVRDSADAGDFYHQVVRLLSDLARVGNLSEPAQREMASWLWGIKTWREPSYPEAEWEDCPNCDGNEMENCPDCEGTGIILDFKGDEDMSCFYCGGTGQTECSECTGLGEVQSDGPSLEDLEAWREKAAVEALSLIEDRPKILSRTGVDHG